MGNLSTSATFVMTLVDPCATTLLTINNPATFVDGSYILRDDPVDRVWDIDTILTRSTKADCGPVTVEFFDDSTGVAPDPAIFDDI